MGEIIFVALLAGGFLIPTALLKQWWLFGTFALFFVCFGIVELLAIHFSGHTVSQHFWALKDVNPVGAWVIVGGMLIGWLALLWHFMGKKKKE